MDKAIIKDLQKSLGRIDEIVEKTNALENTIAEIKKELATKKPEKMTEEKAERFVEWFVKAVVRKDLSTDTSSAGALVPQEFIPDLQDYLNNYGIVRQYGTIIPMDSATASFPKLTGAGTAYWVNENTTITTSDPTFSSVELTAKALAALTRVSNILEGSSAIAIADVIFNAMSKDIARMEDYTFFRGAIASGYPIDGVLVDGSVNVYTMGAGDTSITAITADDLLDMQNMLTNDLAINEGAYVMNAQVFNVVRKLKDSNGNYIYAPAMGGQPATLWGRPVILSSVMPSLADDAADAAMLFYGYIPALYLGVMNEVAVAYSADAGFANLQTYVRVHEVVAPVISDPSVFVVLKTAAV